MALKPPPLSQVLEQVNELVGGSGLGGEVERNARALAQSALGKLDVVSRDEFDAQSEILKRTRDRVQALESELEQLTEVLNKLEKT